MLTGPEDRNNSKFVSNENRVHRTAGSSLRIAIAADGGILQHTDAGRSRRISASVLERSVPGFEPSKPASLNVNYHEIGSTIYSYYKGGKLWLPAFPPGLPRPRGVQTINVAILSPSSFLKRFCGCTLENDEGLRWMPDLVAATKATLGSNTLELGFTQTPPVEGISNYNLKGTASGTLGWNADGTYLQFRISGLFGQSRTLRIYHNGYSQGWMSLQGSMGFERMYLISFDGFRLRLITKAGREFSATTLYVSDPSAIYALNKVDGGLAFTIDGTQRKCKLIQVSVRRELEDKMLRSVATYAHGRLGAEIAYAIATAELGFEEVLLSEPSVGGKDLYTRDGKTVIQARLLTNPAPLQPDRLPQTLRIQITRLIRKLRQDFDYNLHAETGYAILSYLDPTNDSILATVWEIRNRR